MFTIAMLAVPAPQAAACDICAIYTGSLMQQDKTGFWLGLGQQYSDFGSVRTDDRSVPNSHDEWLRSSITQVVAGWSFTPKLGLQVNVPLISREYKRVEEGISVRGDENGFGDISVLGRFIPFSGNVREALIHVELMAGIKTPTGDSDRLAEELGEEEEEEHGEGHLRTMMAGTQAGLSRRLRHEEHHSAVHGHDLALGSGSVDGVFGLNFYAAWKRLFFGAQLQYARRASGDYDYGFADDLTWIGGPGFYVFTEHRYTGALQFVISGEDKGKDVQQGTVLDDTAITAVYLGPGLSFTWMDSLSAQFAVDLPVVQDVTGTQIVPDYRLRGGVTWRF